MKKIILLSLLISISNSFSLDLTPGDYTCKKAQIYNSKIMGEYDKIVQVVRSDFFYAFLEAEINTTENKEPLLYLPKLAQIFSGEIKGEPSQLDQERYAQTVLVNFGELSEDIASDNSKYTDEAFKYNTSYSFHDGYDDTITEISIDLEENKNFKISVITNNPSLDYPRENYYTCEFK